MAKGGYIGSPDGPKPAPCPVEYVVLRAVRYMQGAMKPDDFAPNMHPPELWAHYALMSEMVENDEQVVKAQSQSPPGQIKGTTITINRPRDSERAANA